MSKRSFRWWEWVLAAAVTGAVAGIAIPAWQAHSMRSQIEEGVRLAVESRADIDKYFATRGRLPRHGGEIGLGGVVQDELVEYVTWRRDPSEPDRIGYIDVQMTLQPLGSGITPVLLEARVSGDRLQWRCVSARRHGIAPEISVSDHYLPAQCREGH